MHSLLIYSLCFSVSSSRKKFIGALIEGGRETGIMKYSNAGGMEHLAEGFVD